MLTAHSTTSSISLSTRSSSSIYIYIYSTQSQHEKQGTIADEGEEMWCVVVVVGVTD